MNRLRRCLAVAREKMSRYNALQKEKAIGGGKLCAAVALYGLQAEMKIFNAIAAILTQLAKIVGSSLLARAGRMQRLISFLVSETLEGRSDRLKEYTIAVEVFDKPPDFNPATNPIVRVEVGRLRRLLAQYQLEVGTGDEFVITIPKGSYVPEFNRRSATEPPPGQEGQEWEAVPEPTAPQGLLQTIKDRERRQVTVMACRLDCNPGRDIGADLNPEQYQMSSMFLDAITRISCHYGGTVEGQASDRLLVFFGWPEALENAAGRALTAALEIASFFRGIPEQEKFGVRAAVATGQAIIQPAPDSGREPRVVAEATALAGRILPQVPLNGVLVAESSRRIAGNAFEFVNAGMFDPREGDGLLLWRLIGIRSIASRYSASSPNVQVPIVGRREELALLLRRWHFTQKREGQTITIVGEPGIGKSKLVHAVLDKVASASEQICLRCSPYHSESPLYPISACITANHGGLLNFMYPDEVEEIAFYIKGEERAGGEDITARRSGGAIMCLDYLPPFWCA